MVSKRDIFGNPKEVDTGDEFKDMLLKQVSRIADSLETMAEVSDDFDVRFSKEAFPVDIVHHE